MAALVWPPVVVKRRGRTLIEQQPADPIGRELRAEAEMTERYLGPQHVGRWRFRITTKTGRPQGPFAMSKTQKRVSGTPADFRLKQLGVGGRMRRRLLEWADDAWKRGSLAPTSRAEL